MGLNIKDPEIHELVKELAVLKNTSLTGAVKLAVLSEIEREKAGKEVRKKRSEVLQAFAEEFASRVANPIHSWEIDARLYDESGLPK